MDREDADALERRIFGTVSDDDADGSSESKDASDMATVREGTTRALDPDQLDTMRREQGLTEDDTTAQTERVGGFDADPALAKPGDLPESIDVTKVGPDGAVISDRTLTSPTGEAIGGDSVADQIADRGATLAGDALGGSRLDPLGMLDSSGVGSPTDREIEEAISRADGSQVGWKLTAEFGVPFTDTTIKVEYDSDPPEKPDPLDKPLPPAVRDPDWQNAHPSDEEEEQPDPEAGYDVVTGENVEAAVRTHGIAPYAQPTQDDEGSGAVSTTNLDWAGPSGDPRLTNYGPEGPQTVEVGDDWAPPVDTLFDPPPEGSSAGLAGAQSAMADPGAALSGSVIGSSTPEAPPDPPPTPPGEDPGGDPFGPPPDGEEG